MVHDDFFTVTEQEPYVFAQLLGGVDGSTRIGRAARTGRAPKTGTQGRQPQWHEDTAVELALSPLARTVSVELWNHNLVKDDFIGKMESPLLSGLLFLGQRLGFISTGLPSLT